MRFMILVRASPKSEAGAMPTEELIAGQLAFHQAIDEAGVLIDAMGFHPTARAWRVLQRTDGSREVIEGPFHDDHLIGVFLALWGTLFGPFNVLGWVAVGLNLLLGSGFAWFQIIKPQTRSAAPA